MGNEVLESMGGATRLSVRGLGRLAMSHGPAIASVWLLLSTVLYLSITWMNMPFREPSGKLILVTAQSVLLFPPIALLCGMRGGAGSQLKKSYVHSPVWAAFAIYLLITVPVSARLGTAVSMADESTYLFQARLMEAGKLYTTAPPITGGGASHEPYIPENNVVSGNRWYGMYPPGWPAFLAAWDILLKVPWLANPVLGFFILLLVRSIAAATLGKDVAEASVWILAASPMFTLNCIGYWSEPLAALLLAGALFCFWKGQSSNRLVFYVLMSALVCLALLVRPFESAAFGAVLAALAIWRLRRNWRLTGWFFAASVPIGAATLGLMILYDRATTGYLWRFGYAALEQTKFPTEVSISPAHLLHNLTHATPLFHATTAQAAFPLLFLLAAYGARKAWNSSAVWIFAALSAAIVAAHVAGPETSGCMIGARYYFLPFALLCILGGLGWTHLRPRIVRAGSLNVVVLSALFAAAAGFVYLANYGIAVRLPYGRMDAMLRQIGTRDAVVFAAGAKSRYGPAPAINARFVNVNGADWMNAPAVSFPDPGPGIRSELCRSVGRREWRLVRYDEDARKPIVSESGPCSSAPAGSTSLEQDSP